MGYFCLGYPGIIQDIAEEPGWGSKTEAFSCQVFLHAIQIRQTSTRPVELNFRCSGGLSLTGGDSQPSNSIMFPASSETTTDLPPVIVPPPMLEMG